MPVILRFFAFCLIGSFSVFNSLNAQVAESFDNWSDGSYGGVATSTLAETPSGIWETNNTICGSSNARSGNGIRFNDNSGENEYLLYKGLDGNGKDGGVGTVSFWYRHWNGGSSAVQFQTQYDAGSGWVNIGGVIDVTSTAYAQFSETVNVAGDNIFIRVISIDDAERLMIDDFGITNFAASSNDTTTEVYDPGTQVASGNIASTNDNSSAAVDVFSMTIEDQSSGDGLDTKVTNIRIKPHTSNTADWTDHIQGIVIDDGTSFLTPSSVTITDTEIDIAFPATELVIPDAGPETDVTIAIYLNTSNIVDNSVFSCFVDADDHGFTADASGSSFISDFTLGDVVSNDFDIEVAASVFAFQQEPTNGATGIALSPSVEVAAQDVNGNIDLDYNLNIPLSTTGSFDAGATTTVAAVNGVAVFDNLIFDASGTGLTLTAEATNDGVFVTSNEMSTSFDIAEPVKIIISRVADPSDNPSDSRFVEIKNIGITSQDISGWELNRYVNTSTSPSVNTINPGAILAPGETYIIGNSASFSTNYGCDPSETNGNIAGNGDDTYALFDDGDVLIDIYGEIGTDGTNEDWEYENSIAVRNAGVTAANTVWTSSEWTITSAGSGDITVCPVPDNDLCSNATVVTCGTSLLNETTGSSTDNGDATGCSYGKGVWYSFVGTNQEVTVRADGSDGNFDLGLSISTSDDCANFVNIDCVDDYGGLGFEETTFFANSGTTYYFYIAYYGNNSTDIGQFDLTVSCTNVGVSATMTGNCYTATSIVSTGTEKWLNIIDGSDDLVASVFDSENLGTITTNVFLNASDVREDGNGVAYLDRNISITPTSQPSGTIKVRLYLTTAEYNALTAADNNINSIADLNITKTDGSCSAAFSEAGTFISQSGSGTLNAGYFVEVEISSFSSFFLHAGIEALPVSISNFTAKPFDSAVELSFTTSIEENNAYFIIEHSTEGKVFKEIGRINGKGNSQVEVKYNFIDWKPVLGDNYYRLKQVDFDGTFEYFGPILAKFNTKETAAEVYPNPNNGKFNLAWFSEEEVKVVLYDMNGRRLFESTFSEGAQTYDLDISQLPKGMYNLVLESNNAVQNERLIIK